MSRFLTSWRGALTQTLGALALGCVSSVVPAGATTITYRTDAELVSLSERVVHGRVRSVRAEATADGRRIYTVARLEVLEDFTGIGEPEIDVYELGGRVGDAQMFVTGGASFVVGQEVIVCLERFDGNKLRSVAMSFSKFDIQPLAAGGATAVRQAGAVVLGQTSYDSHVRTPDDFRQVVSAVKGTRGIKLQASGGAASRAEASAPVAAQDEPVFDGFSLLGSGMRWNQSDTGAAIQWYRNADAPAPVSGSNGDAEIATALQAWTAPTGASLTLSFAGPRALGGQSPYCTSANSGVGLITFEDPTNEVGSGVLAIGGGCSTSAGAKTVNGQYFASFSHGFIVFNTAAELGASYTTALNFTRILTHELGHAIGLGHTPSSTSSATSNIMYPSCCYISTPTPPALGADDLAGLAYIYPASTGGSTCTFTVSPTTVQVGFGGGVASVTVTTSSGCTWQASSQASWLSVSSGSSGSGGGTVSFSYAANGASARSGALLVAGQLVTVFQDAASAPSSCSFAASPSSASFPAAGGSGQVTVSTSGACAWTSGSPVPWVVITGGSMGSGSGTVSLLVDVNAGPARSATLTVAGQPVTITQAGAATSCTYSVSTGALSLGAAGGSTSLVVSTSASCAWTSSSSGDWLAISAGQTGTGGGIVTVVANANTGAQRSASLNIAGQSVAVVQAATTSSCTFTVTPNQAQFGPTGGQGSASIFASPGCGWSAAVTTAWMGINAGTSGTGNGTVSFAIGANSGPARAGTIMVAGQVVSVTQDETANTDADNDGLPDSWEQQFGLSAASGAGDDGASGDPDGDGHTNLAEYQALTHPRGFYTRYLAEGAASSFFTTTVAIGNPTANVARVWLRFQTTTQSTATSSVIVPAMSQRTVLANAVAGLTQASFATVIESDEEVVVDRRMEWDASGYGAHAETSTAAPQTTWYLAEGATHSGFELFYLLQNPSALDASVEITYLLPAPAAPVVKTYAVGAGSRANVWVDREDDRLGNADVSAVIRSTNGVAIIVERAMYLNTGGQVFGAGHASAGVAAPATSWFLAEGATGSYFDDFVLIANPSSSQASVQARYLLPDGTVLTKGYVVPGQSRFTIWVDGEDALLANTAVSVEVSSLNAVPILVERAMWWPGPTPSSWQESHNSPGSPETGTAWAIADGELGGSRGIETFLLIANTSGIATDVTVTLLMSYQAPLARTFSVPANGRFSVDVAAAFPDAINDRFGALIESQTAGASIVVERAMYWDANSVQWAAGSDALATKLR